VLTGMARHPGLAGGANKRRRSRLLVTPDMQGSSMGEEAPMEKNSIAAHRPRAGWRSRGFG